MSKRANIVVTDILQPPCDIELEVLGDVASVQLLQAKSVADLIGKVENADVIMAWQGLQWDAGAIGLLESCKGIVRVGVGFDNIDLEAAKAAGLVVCNVPDYGTADVADHAMALTLQLARALSAYNRRATAGPEHWEWNPEIHTFRVTGKSMGIVGLGRIGTATALRAKAFGMEIGFFDPYITSGWEKSLDLSRYYSLQELARNSDIVSLHVPLTDETLRMIDQTFFQSLKEGAILINTSRGAIVDWAAFGAAFLSGKLHAAGLDVLPVEPPDFTDPILQSWGRQEAEVRDRLVITPHCAFYSEEAYSELRRKGAEEALRILRGEEPLNRITRD